MCWRRHQVRIDKYMYIIHYYNSMCNKCTQLFDIKNVLISDNNIDTFMSTNIDTIL